MKSVAVIGEGAWGTAIATLLAHKGHKVKLWCHDAAVAETLRKMRVNQRYLPGIMLDDSIEPVTDLSYAVEQAEWIFEAIPVKFLRSVLQRLVGSVNKEQKWVILSKGVEQDTLLFPTEIIDELFSFKPFKIVLAGPNFAQELALKKISAATIAVPDCSIVTELHALLSTDYFKPYITLDMIGTQVGGALKNVIALAIGMLEGAGYSENAKAFVLTRGLYEMMLLAKKLGGNSATVYGLSGAGDLVLTAMGSLSKNVKVGYLLAQGETLDSIVGTMGIIAEGINTVQSINQLMKQENIDLPICRYTYEVIFKGLSINAMVSSLMAGPIEQECEY